MKNITDKRTREYKTLHLWFNQYTRAAAVAGLIVGSLITLAYVDAVRKQPVKELLSPLSEVHGMEVTPTPNLHFCDDVISCIRDVGEELGEPNSHILTMIRIAKAESGYRPDAINKNTNGTFDVGVMQINDVHGKRISRTDRMNYEKNIRFAYQLHQEQGHRFTAWSVYNKGLVK